MRYIKFLALTLVCSSGLYAQYAPVPPTPQFPSLATTINAKPAMTTGVGAPASACTKGLDLYSDSATGLFYQCVQTNRWALVSTTLTNSTLAFTPQQPGGVLGTGANSITLTPVPAGVNASNVGYWVYLSGGSGTAEAVLVTGGTATAGSTSGTILFTTAHTHSGAWTVQSATAGIAEALNALPSTGGVVSLGSGTFNIYGTISANRTVGMCVVGQGERSTILNWLGSTSGDVVDFDGPNSPGGAGLNNCFRGV